MSSIHNTPDPLLLGSHQYPKKEQQEEYCCGAPWRGRAGTSLLIIALFSVYEAGKAAKAGYPSAVTSIPGPYYIPTVPGAGVPSPAVLMEKSHPPPLAPSDSSGGSQNGNLHPVSPVSLSEHSESAESSKEVGLAPWREWCDLSTGLRA